jgi:prevent-host-death family protein
MPSATRRRAERTAVAPFRNVRGEVRPPSAVTASEAKNEFARVLDMATHEGAVVITKHDVPRAVLMSVENFNALAAHAETTLDALEVEFDALVARMQTPAARRAMKKAFGASGRQLGRAAATAARRRG